MKRRRPREGEQPKMYKSPITVDTGEVKFDGLMEKIEKEFADHIDDAIIRAVMETNVEVDREELIRAMRFDRCQYQKGYIDGYEAAGMKIVHCGECKHGRFGEWNYCDVFADDLLDRALEPDDYCSRGERKEERDG